MRTAELHYDLPPELIAQHSVRPRDTSRLLAVARRTGVGSEYVFKDIKNFLRRGDVLVCNNTKVFRARLRAVAPTGGAVEVFLLRPTGADWLCLGRPGKRLRVGAKIFFSRTLTGEVRACHDSGECAIRFWAHGRALSAAAVLRFAARHGEIPLPPYVTHGPTKLSDYQTVLARRVGSVAAPTAGFHFTRVLLTELKKRGVTIVTVTLHVGLGTFQPIKTERVEEHPMHSEWVSITPAVARKILAAKKSGRRVIAVGTTTTRALEGWAAAGANVRGFGGNVNIFIRPGFTFQIIDGLVTNFHLPKSTLLLLVAAFLSARSGVGLARLKKIYAHAIAARWRFYSFGDAMFIF